MAIERPDFNYDGSGNAIVPAADAPKEHNELVSEIERTPAPAAPAPSVPARTGVRDEKGNIIREDWSRNEQGQFVSKDVAAMKEEFSKSGGYEYNVSRIAEVEQMMLTASGNAGDMQEAIAELPKEVQLKAADVMRLSTSHGPNGGVIKAETFLNSLSPTEFETFRSWFRDSLDDAQRTAILGALSL